MNVAFGKNFKKVNLERRGNTSGVIIQHRESCRRGGPSCCGTVMVAKSDAIDAMTSTRATGETAVTPARTMSSAARGQVGGSLKVPREKAAPKEKFESI